jgi:hypothetical protein
VTLFEFISAAVSIVLALSAGQILLNLREVFDPTRRYWVHAVWVVQALIIHVLVWWSLWAYRGIQWDLASFVLVLVPAGLLFVMSSALVPNSSSTVTSWEAHFFEVRRWFFAARILFIIGAGFRSWFLLDKPILESPTPVSQFVLVLLIAGILIANRRFQAVLVVVTSVLLVCVAYVRLEAGAG